MYFTPEDFFYVFIRLLSQVFIRDAPGISEKDENRSKSTKVTKVTETGQFQFDIWQDLSIMTIASTTPDSKKLWRILDG